MDAVEVKGLFEVRGIGLGPGHGQGLCQGFAVLAGATDSEVCCEGELLAEGQDQGAEGGHVLAQGTRTDGDEVLVEAHTDLQEGRRG